MGPVWREKPEAARKAMNRLNLALKYASAVGADVDLRAPSKAKTLLGPQRQTVRRIPAMPYQDIPSFYRELTRKNEMSALALRFLILTAARTSEVRLISSKETKANVWSLPGERTKSGRAFRIPLTKSAQSVLDEARALSPNDYFFISVRGKPLSDMAMSKFMKRQGLVARPHGFRAAFRTWAEEQTDFAFEVKESALGHNVDRGVVAAYQRSDRFEKRRLLLESWEEFLGANQYRK
uniref:tyrosine-type recombinase/integrase n=1 Tax=uncultured Altererythrobacter sp. TaxID=500840 RepID=UPI0026020827|nr:site-specific integrase [uncultured Altererythrobacter sp.]